MLLVFWIANFKRKMDPLIGGPCFILQRQLNSGDSQDFYLFTGKEDNQGRGPHPKHHTNEVKPYWAREKICPHFPQNNLAMWISTLLPGSRKGASLEDLEMIHKYFESHSGHFPLQWSYIIFFLGINL